MYKGKSTMRSDGIVSLLAGLGLLLTLGSWSIAFGIPEAFHRFAGWLFLMIGAIAMSCLGLWWLHSDYRSRTTASISINSASRAGDLQARHSGEMVEASSAHGKGSASYPSGYVPLKFENLSGPATNPLGFQAVATGTLFSPQVGAVLILSDPWWGQGSTEMMINLYHHPAFVGMPSCPSISSPEYRDDTEILSLGCFKPVGKNNQTSKFMANLISSNRARTVDFPNGTSVETNELFGKLLPWLIRLDFWEAYKPERGGLEFAVPEELTKFSPVAGRKPQSC